MLKLAIIWTLILWPLEQICRPSVTYKTCTIYRLKYDTTYIVRNMSAVSLYVSLDA